MQLQLPFCWGPKKTVRDFLGVKFDQVGSKFDPLHPPRITRWKAAAVPPLSG